MSSLYISKCIIFKLFKLKILDVLLNEHSKASYNYITISLLNIYEIFIILKKKN